MWNARTDFDQFQCRYVRYAPRLVSSLNVPVLSYTTFDEILKVFRTWLESIEVALENKATPDLWLQTASYETLVGSPPTRDISTEQFSVESIYQLRLSIQELRLLVVGEFTPTQEQLKVIDDRLDYLSDALERLNQFDWKALLLSTLIGIATTLSLDTQTGKALYQLFLQAFRSAVHLLSS